MCVPVGVCVCLRICVRAYTCMCVCMRLCVRVRACVPAHVCVPAHTCACLCVRACVLGSRVPIPGSLGFTPVSVEKQQVQTAEGAQGTQWLIIIIKDGSYLSGDEHFT